MTAARSIYEKDPNRVPSTTARAASNYVAQRPIEDYLDGAVAVLQGLATPQRLICEACGCLCRADEVCPGCKAARR